MISIVTDLIGETQGMKLWRYMDLHKFLSLIRSREIFFARIDSMEDPNEAISRDQLFKKHGEKVMQNELMQDNGRTELPLEQRQKTYFTSCWIENNRESMAMWGSYSQPDSIALRIDKETLIQEFENKHFSYVRALCAAENGYQMCDAQERVRSLYISKMFYKNFLEEEGIRNMKRESPILGFHKDIAYQHENEFRFLLKQEGEFRDGEIHFDDIKFFLIGLLNFDDLPFEVVFHPRMEPWQKDNIRSLVKAYNLPKMDCCDSEVEIRR